MTSSAKAEYVYAGALVHEESVAHSYIRIDGGVLGDASLFADAWTRHAPGSVLEVVEAERGVVVDTARYRRVWSDDEQVTMWRAMHAATLESERAYQADEPAHMLDALAPVREAYQQMDDRERAVLLAQVVAYIAIDSEEN